VPTDLAELTAFYAFRDFPHFIDVYMKVALLVRTPDDIVVLVAGLARDAAASNVRYAEVTVTVASHLAVGMTPDEVSDAVLWLLSPAARMITGVALPIDGGMLERTLAQT